MDPGTRDCTDTEIGRHRRSLRSAEDLPELSDHAGWRVERPGTAERLDAIGAHHPDRGVAKAARKCLVRHRSRVANSR